MEFTVTKSTGLPFASHLGPLVVGPRSRRTIKMASTVGLGLLVMTGCTAPQIVMGGAASVGVMAADERSVGTVIDDATIEADISRRYFDYHVDDLFRPVNVEVKEGRVLLTGTVKNTNLAIEAVKRAWQSDGVREVINEIEIGERGDVGDYTRDAWIATQLRSDLLFDKEVYALNYTIEVENATVYLIGLAQDQTELDRVVEHARTIRRVRKVVSYVRLKDDPRRKRESE